MSHEVYLYWIVRSELPLTLKIMLVVALILVPLIIAYQAWVYILFSGKVTEEKLAYH